MLLVQVFSKKACCHDNWFRLHWHFFFRDLVTGTWRPCGMIWPWISSNSKRNIIPVHLNKYLRFIRKFVLNKVNYFAFTLSKFCKYCVCVPPVERVADLYSLFMDPGILHFQKGVGPVPRLRMPQLTNVKNRLWLFYLFTYLILFTNSCFSVEKSSNNVKIEQLYVLFDF